MITYLLIGAIWTFILDCILYKLRNHTQIVPLVRDWGWKERAACVIAWPLTLTAFIYSFFKEYFE